MELPSIRIQDVHSSSNLSWPACSEGRGLLLPGGPPKEVLQRQLFLFSDIYPSDTLLLSLRVGDERYMRLFFRNFPVVTDHYNILSVGNRNP